MRKHTSIVPLPFDTYLAVIENSCGSYVYKNLYVLRGRTRVDVTQDGLLSCAFFVSSILYMFSYIDKISATVQGVVKNLEKKGWIEIQKPKPGSVIVWENQNGHKHIGFYTGNGVAASNDSHKKCIVLHHWEYGGKRKVEKILYNPNLSRNTTT